MTEHSPSARPGRWRSGAESRQRILEAARALFREHGYGGTTVRAVAAQAEVDPAMVFYFFKTKQGLFAAATEMPPHLPSAIESIFTGGLDGVGERIIRTLLENLDKPGRTPLMMLTRSAPLTRCPKHYSANSSTGKSPVGSRRCSTRPTPRYGPAW